MRVPGPSQIGRAGSVGGAVGREYPATCRAEFCRESPVGDRWARSASTRWRKAVSFRHAPSRYAFRSAVDPFWAAASRIDSTRSGSFTGSPSGMSGGFGAVADGPAGTAALDQDDFVPAVIEMDLVHERADQQQAASARPLEVGRVCRIGKSGGIEAGTFVADYEAAFLRRQQGLDVDLAIAVGGLVRPLP